MDGPIGEVDVPVMRLTGGRQGRRDVVHRLRRAAALAFRDIPVSSAQKDRAPRNPMQTAAPRRGAEPGFAHDQLSNG